MRLVMVRWMCGWILPLGCMVRLVGLFALVSGMGVGDWSFRFRRVADNFARLTQKGIRSTQALIDDYLKIDYDTFINSAYLRQGKADEFMRKKPADRKQILADLLKLDRYEQLADRAKESAQAI